MVDWLAGGDTAPNLARGYVDSRDVEYLDAFTGRNEIPGTRRDPQPRQLEHLLRLFPRGEPDELVGADQEQGIVQSAGAQHVYRERERIELDLEAGERDPGHLQAKISWSERRLVPGRLAYEDDQAIERETAPGGVHERDVTVVRRVE